MIIPKGYKVPKLSKLAIMVIKQKLFESLCKDHDGKMLGMWSVSTSPFMNPYCIARHKNGNSICSKCFSIALNEQRPELREKLERNTILWTTEIIPIECFPILPVTMFRFESFGDLNNIIQLVNYFNFCLVNPDVKFAIWTKNTFLFKMARELGVIKPKNLEIVESAPLFNTEIDPSDEWVDRVFVVYTKEYFEADFINCGLRKCIECQNCYNPNGPKVIKELVKSAQKMKPRAYLTKIDGQWIARQKCGAIVAITRTKKECEKECRAKGLVPEKAR